MDSTRKSSLFDDIFQLQSTIPDIDPEDPEDGFKSGLTEGASEAEALAPTQLRKQAAIIPDDPKYRGKRISRQSLYSEEEPDSSEESDVEASVEVDRSEEDDSFDDDGDSSEEDGKEETDPEENEDDSQMDIQGEAESDAEDDEDTTVLAPSDSSNKEKGKSVAFQVDLWDDLIKCRISLQKVIAACNRLPTPDTWKKFAAFPSFQKESLDARQSMGKVVLSLLELQERLSEKLPAQGKSLTANADMDEEITSESEVEDEEDSKEAKPDKKTDGNEDSEDNEGDEDVGGDDDDDEEAEEMEESTEEMDADEDGEGAVKLGQEGQRGEKRKVDDAEVEETLQKRHKEFHSFRNATLEKWDEKTRLSHAKIKSKNFAAFDISVLKQIQQVLGNKDRLIRRIHQNRSGVQILGQKPVEEKLPQDQVVEDDDDDMEITQKKTQPEVELNYEIVDDSDFYQVCLRDFIQLKQNEETDPVLANKFWLEIQSMRKKHKRKVDTRASKGRKIRYHVKEKLKNFMAPYDKSVWSEEQKDDLFKALFGGQQDTESESKVSQSKQEEPTINIGL